MIKKLIFTNKVEKCDDHEDILQNLTDYLQEFTGSTSVYVAKLVAHKIPIEEDDDETAHVDDKTPMHLDIIHVSPKQYEFILRNTIEAHEGVSHDVFQIKEEKPVTTEGEQPTEGEGDAEKAEKEKPKSDFLIIDEVVRERRVKFFRVPRLGSLFCIKLTYNSCLFEHALDEGVNDFLDVEARKRQQEIDISIWEEKEAKRKEEAEKNEQEFEEEHKEWEKITEKEFITTPVEYAVCLDTMGQDRKFTQAEIDLSLKAISNFILKWEEQERRSLRVDVTKRVERLNDDKVFLERYKLKYEDILDKWIDQNTEENEEPKEESARIEERKKLKLDYFKKILNGHKIEVRIESPPETNKKDDRKDRRGKRDQHKDESKEEAKEEPEEEIDYTDKWKKDIVDLKGFKIIKNCRIIQSAFYLLGYFREDICEEKTNKLCWKKAKKYINDEFFNKLHDYNPIGSKCGEYKKYQKINFIQKNLEEVKLEELEHDCVSLSFVYKYLQTAIEIRRGDVQKRYFHYVKLKEERDQAVEQENERLNERKAFLEEERKKWDDEHQKPEEVKKEGEGEGEGDANEGEGEQQAVERFNEAEVLAKFDAEKEPIKIPPEVVMDVDNDVDLTEEEMTITKE